jgi:hypothetical protein
MHKHALDDKSKSGLCGRMPRCSARAENQRADISACLVAIQSWLYSPWTSGQRSCWKATSRPPENMVSISVTSSNICRYLCSHAVRLRTLKALLAPPISHHTHAKKRSQCTRRLTRGNPARKVRADACLRDSCVS